MPASFESAIQAQADAIKRHLEETVTELGDLTVISSLEANIGVKIHAATAKSKGGVILIAATGGRNLDQNASGLEMNTAFGVEIIVQPEKRKNEAGAQIIKEQVMHALSQLPLTSSDHCTRQVIVESWRLIRNDTYQIYEIKCNTPTVIKKTIY